MLIIEVNGRKLPLINLSGNRTFGQANENTEKEDAGEAISKLTPPCEQHILMRGDSGSCVALVQTILKRLGYYDGEITGEFDEATEMALINFQKDNSDFVEDTGVVDKETWELLSMYADPSEFCMIISSTPNCFEIPRKGGKGLNLQQILLIAGLGILAYVIYKDYTENRDRGRFIVEAIRARE